MLPEGVEAREDTQAPALPWRPGGPAPTPPLQQHPHPHWLQPALLWSLGLQRER